MSWHSLYVWRGRTMNAAAGGTTSTSTGLAYSDYFFMTAIVAGIVGGSTFVASLMSQGGFTIGQDITGFASLLATITTTLGKYLQSKGD